MRFSFGLDFTIERSRPEPPERPDFAGSDGHFDLARPEPWPRTETHVMGFAPNPH